MKYVDATCFTWSGNHGVAESSSLFGTGQVHSELSVHGRERTIHFVGVDSIRDSRGDIICWEYVAPGTPFTLTVYND